MHNPAYLDTVTLRLKVLNFDSIFVQKLVTRHTLLETRLTPRPTHYSLINSTHLICHLISFEPTKLLGDASVELFGQGGVFCLCFGARLDHLWLRHVYHEAKDHNPYIQCSLEHKKREKLLSKQLCKHLNLTMTQTKTETKAPRFGITIS